MCDEARKSCGVDLFPDLGSIVLCEFDSIVGPRMSSQFPPFYCAEDIFRRVYHFLIIKQNDLCENGISWTDDISGLSLAGYPVLIENPKYARNALIFNVCLVGGRYANVNMLLCMAEKLARLLKAAELQFGFLSKEEKRIEKLASLIENIYTDLKSKGETRRVLDGSFPFFVSLPKTRLCQFRNKNTKIDIKPAEVPYLRPGPYDENWSITDCVGKKVVSHIDGKTSVAQLAAFLPVPYSTVTAVISQLFRLGLIGLRPTVNQWDMYTSTSRLRQLLSDEKMRGECIKQATLTIPHNPKIVEPVPFNKTLNILTQLQHGVTISDLKLRNKSITDSIDLSKLILFALENQLIRRVFISPVFTPELTRPSGGSITAADESFSQSFSNRASETPTSQTSRNAGNNITSTVSDESRLEQAYRLMDGNHTLEFIAARAAMDPGELLRIIRGDPRCELLLRGFTNKFSEKMAAEMSASATSGKYLMEIKAIYQRLKGEYEYLRKKQEQQYKQPLEEQLEAELGQRDAKASLDSDGYDNSEMNNHIEGAKIDQMIASSVEELVESENETLRERVAQLEAEVTAKNRDWKRIRASYEQLQEANEKLKQQLGEASTERTKLDARYKQLMSRFTNLQAFKVDRSDSAKQVCSKSTSVPSAKSAVVKNVTSGRVDAEKLLNFSLEALAEVAASGIHQAAAPIKSSSAATSTNLIFALAELLRNLPPSLASQNRVVEPLLRLFYETLPWTLPTGEESGSDLRPGISLSLQKCGEILFRCPSNNNTSSTAASISESISTEMTANTVSSTRRPPAVFFRSSQLTTRFLSTLIILRTVTRADILAQALDCLLRDCQSETGREAFVRFDAARVVVLFMRPHNKAFVGTSLAIVARLLTSSQMLTNSFTEIFLTERFVCALSMLLDSPAVSGEDLEKLSTILAKLAVTIRARHKSTSGTAARLFNAFGITETIQRMLKRVPTSENPSSAALSPVVVSNFRQIVAILATPSTPSIISGPINNGGANGDSSIMAEDLSCGSLLLS